MTNKQHILQLLNGLDDETLCDIYMELPEEIKNRKPILGPCESCPHREDDDCFADNCNRAISDWMAAEVEFQ